MKPDYTIVLQAGGASQRMGQDKARMPFNGQPLLLHIVKRLLRSLNHRQDLAWLLITNGRREDFTFLEAVISFRCCADLIPGLGALGGLYTAFAAAETTCAAVIACDLPFADGELVEMGFHTLTVSGADVFMPRTPAGLEPMHAVYRCEPCLAAVIKALERGERKAISWLGDVRTHYHDCGEGLTFRNVNSPLELAEAEALDRSLAGENPENINNDKGEADD